MATVRAMYSPEAPPTSNPATMMTQLPGPGLSWLT